MLNPRKPSRSKASSERGLITDRKWQPVLVGHHGVPTMLLSSPGNDRTELNENLMCLISLKIPTQLLIGLMMKPKALTRFSRPRASRLCPLLWPPPSTFSLPPQLRCPVWSSDPACFSPAHRHCSIFLECSPDGPGNWGPSMMRTGNLKMYTCI